MSSPCLPGGPAREMGEGSKGVSGGKGMQRRHAKDGVWVVRWTSGN